MASSLSRATLVYNSTHFQLNRTRFATARGPLAELLQVAYRFSRPKLSSVRGAIRCCSGVVPPRAVAVADRVSAEVLKEEKVLRVGVICGGPSAERGISLNSARSVIDHIQGDDLHVSCYYIDTQLNAFAISTAQVYSNTPSDFDFKLESLAQVFPTLSDFAEHLALSVDIVFPVIHGQFGEDGGIQELLENFNIPFVGTGSMESRKAFDKYEASLELSRQGFITVPNFLAEVGQIDQGELSHWFERNQLDKNVGKVVVKPARAGSSIGVIVAYGVLDSLEKAKGIITEGIDTRVLIEKFLEGGSEFTAIILDVGSAGNCEPVVLLPTEVELQSLGSLDVNDKDAIFNYRKKYLPTQQVAYHTPPRFPLDVIESIREGASQLFRSLGLRDFARIDGWFLPSSVDISADSEKTGNSESGTVLFTDINLISGMEQTSFLFQQASKVGFSHSNILRSIIHRACSRYPSVRLHSTAPSSLPKIVKSSHLGKAKDTKKVFVIFGGDTSERQVSLMSGTNVWLNLQSFDDINVVPCLLAPTNANKSTKAFGEKEDVASRPVWLLPHTTEEVLDACLEAIEPARAAFTSKLRNQVINDIMDRSDEQSWFSGFDLTDEVPKAYTLGQWIKLVKEAKGTVFIAVHGGIGEDGTLQSLLENNEIPYTGPSAAASKICMDKVATSLAINHLTSSGVLTIEKDVRRREDLLSSPLNEIWTSLTSKLNCLTLCVKPARDGCSTGVARLSVPEDLVVYVKALKDKLLRIPPNSFSKAHGMIEMPNPPPECLIFEPFIETSEVAFSSRSVNENQGHLIWEGKSRWVEITVGVIGKRGSMRSLSPSITVKETGDILSLEEKFQGGTGINLTPPPSSIISDEALEKCKGRIELVANTLQLEGFSRIDAFLNVDTGEVLIIEVNTVPGMTPSTVLIHQALAETPPMYPHNFFHTLLDLGSDRFM